MTKFTRLPFCSFLVTSADFSNLAREKGSIAFVHTTEAYGSVSKHDVLERGPFCTDPSHNSAFLKNAE